MLSLSKHLDSARCDNLVYNLKSSLRQAQTDSVIYNFYHRNVMLSLSKHLKFPFL